MKKVKILLASVLFCAMICVAYSSYNQMIESKAFALMSSNVEALTSGEPGGGANIECRCTSEVSISVNGCYADGKSNSVCHGGVNAKCWEYHLNCKKSGL